MAGEEAQRPAFGISTIWRASRVGSGTELLAAIEDSGISVDGIELEYRIPESWYREILPRLKRRDPRVLSIHNFFPLPEDRDQQQASGDLYFFTSDDPEERREAVRGTVRTIEIAEDLGAGAVVLHLGKVGMEQNRRDELVRLWKEGSGRSPEAEKVREDLRKERAAKAKKPLDRVLKALDTLNREADRRGIRIGVENRYYFDEIPGPEEIGIILREFAGGAVRYWHDVGHAHVLSYAGFPEFEDLLERYCADLAGIHLHDAVGFRDHRAPGTGEIDFGKIASLLPPGAIRIIEVFGDETAENISEGLSRLREMGM